MSTSPQLWEGSDESITALLAESGNGNREAEARLIAKVYDELRRIARKLMAGERVGHTLQASALVNEAYLRLFENQQIDRQNYAADASYPGGSRQESRRPYTRWRFSVSLLPTPWPLPKITRSTFSR